MMDPTVDVRERLLSVADAVEELLPPSPVFVLPLDALIEAAVWEHVRVLEDVLNTDYAVSEADLAAFLGVRRGGVGQACAHMIALVSCDDWLDRDLPLRVGRVGGEVGHALRVAADLLEVDADSREMVVSAAASIRGAVEMLKVRAACRIGGLPRVWGVMGAWGIPRRLISAAAWWSLRGRMTRRLRVLRWLIRPCWMREIVKG